MNHKDGSKILTITSNIAEVKELETKCFHLTKTILELTETVKQKEVEIAHLKKLLEGAVLGLPSDIVMPLTDEEEIASIQLEKIKNLSRNRELSLDEIKKYDLLVKNKRLAKGEVTAINGDKSLPKTLGKADLLAIAGKKDKKDGNTEGK